MTKTCNHHFLVNQEKGEKHVFRKSNTETKPKIDDIIES